MAKIDGGEMLVRMLEQEGVNTLFVPHGGHLDPILLAAAPGSPAPSLIWSRSPNERGIPVFMNVKARGMVSAAPG